LSVRRVLLSWSSGKDSAWALHLLRQQADVAVVGLLTTFDAATAAAAMHGTPRALVEAQAEVAGLPLWAVDLPWPCPNAEYERRMGAAVARARQAGVTHAAFGDLFLEDIRAYRVRQLAGSGIDPLFPLWGQDTAALARRMIAGGLGARLVCVDSKQLDRSFVGRQFDESFLTDLSPETDPCGERGEFHTFCFSGPMFSHEIGFYLAESTLHNGFCLAAPMPL